MIPEKELALSVDMKTLTLNDLALFEPGGFSVRGFMTFLAAHSNWTHAEIGLLTVSEFEQVSKLIGEQLRSAAVPKANGVA